VSVFLINVIQILQKRNNVLLFLKPENKSYQNNFSISPDRISILAAKRRDRGESGNCSAKNAGTIRSKSPLFISLIINELVF